MLQPALKDKIIFLGSDQPETCRYCGARTEFHIFANGLQLHQCIRCAECYLVEFESG